MVSIPPRLCRRFCPSYLKQYTDCLRVWSPCSNSSLLTSALLVTACLDSSIIVSSIDIYLVRLIIVRWWYPFMIKCQSIFSLTHDTHLIGFFLILPHNQSQIPTISPIISIQHTWTLDYTPSSHASKNTPKYHYHHRNSIFSPLHITITNIANWTATTERLFCGRKAKITDPSSSRRRITS